MIDPFLTPQELNKILNEGLEEIAAFNDAIDTGGKPELQELHYLAATVELGENWETIAQIFYDAGKVAGQRGY